MNFQIKSRNGNEKEYFREFDAFGNCRQVLEQNGWNGHQKSGKVKLIPNSSRPIPTFFYGKVFELKWCQRWKKNIWNNEFPKKI